MNRPLFLYNETMFLVGLISWWYGRGWIVQGEQAVARFKAALDFFSIGQLLGTFFDPFRQISAMTPSDGSLGTAMRGGVEKLISRCVGMVVRFVTIIAGLCVVAFHVLHICIVFVFWWFLPLFPVIGLILFAIGWIPAWR